MNKIITFLTIFLISTQSFAETKLSWEAKSSKNSEWTSITLFSIEKYFEQLDQAKDISLFCPDYKYLDKQQKINVWGELIAQLALHESAWNPNCQFTEHDLGIDKVTGLPVVSEGLLQLSYGDKQWATWCQFDFELDKSVKTFKTSILDPKNNLECGIGILARQIRKHERITLDKGVYWSTLRINGQRNKIDPISKMIKNKFPSCVNKKS